MLFINVLTLQYKKVSQSINIVSHIFHCYFSIKVTLDDKVVSSIEEESIAYFFET